MRVSACDAFPAHGFSAPGLWRSGPRLFPQEAGEVYAVNVGDGYNIRPSVFFILGNALMRLDAPTWNLKFVIGGLLDDSGLRNLLLIALPSAPQPIGRQRCNCIAR